jgi:glucose/arabinose dehydrogenase
LLALAGPRSALAGTVPTGFSDVPAVTLGSGKTLDRPVGMAFLPDGRVLVIEQVSAKIRLFVGGSLSTTDPVVSLPGVNPEGGEEGLLGIAVDPGWPARPYLYIHCGDGSGPHIRVSRYTASGELTLATDGHLTVDPATRYDVINDLPDNAGNHNGGTVRFGPDGMLYVSLGDDMNHCAAQDSSVLVGKILRLDVSRLPAGAGGPAPRALITPPGNPYAASPDSNSHLVWAMGLRNPFRFGVDSVDGSLIIGDVGEVTWEEVDWAPTGGLNFGWPLREGPAAYNYSCPNPLVAGTSPIFTWNRVGNGGSVIGGCVYHRPPGATHGLPAEYEGDAFFGDYYYYTGFLKRLHRTGSTWALAAPVPGQPATDDWGEGYLQVSEWQVGPDGGLWYCLQSVNYAGNTGQIREIRATNDTSVPPPVSVPGVSFALPRPSPSIGSASLSYVLPTPARVNLRIYDARGRLVRTLVAPEGEGAGPHAARWDGRGDDARDASPGIYFARLDVGGASYQQKLTFLR